MPVKKTTKNTTVKKTVKRSNKLEKFPKKVIEKVPKEELDQEDLRDHLGSVFDIQKVDEPLIGAPSEVQEELDQLALHLQSHPDDEEAFQRIVHYMHKYLLGLVFKKYAFIKGYQESDIYQEALIALFKKAVPSFKTGKGMSFLNFAKLCVNRHLITILHASKHRCKDMPMNTAISLDHNPAASEGEDDGSCPLSNVISDQMHQEMPYEDMSRSECFRRTMATIREKLSQFEAKVLDEYLLEQSYKEAARNIKAKYGERCNQKSIDNALLRIRKKAAELLKELGEDAEDMIPLVFGGHK